MYYGISNSIINKPNKCLQVFLWFDQFPWFILGKLPWEISLLENHYYYYYMNFVLNLYIILINEEFSLLWCLIFPFVSKFEIDLKNVWSFSANRTDYRKQPSWLEPTYQAKYRASWNYGKKTWPKQTKRQQTLWLTQHNTVICSLIFKKPFVLKR